MAFQLRRVLIGSAAAAQTAWVSVFVTGLVAFPSFTTGVDAKPAGGSVQPKICKPMVKSKGTGATGTIAKNKAIDRWESAAASRYGASFSDLDEAKIITIPIGFTGGRWWVIVKAMPCKPIGFGIRRGVRGVPKNFSYPFGR